MIRRTFIPGSEWLYFKLYTGSKTADELLTQQLLPFITELFSHKRIDSFFFIRYSDPDFHIRVRLHVPDPLNYSLIFGDFYRLFQPLTESEAVVKVQCDTYVREIERYGANTMPLLETLFFIDSTAVLELLADLSKMPADEREKLRWQLALLLLDDTLSSFEFAPQEKSRLTGRMAANFKQEFGFTSHVFTRQLNDKFRKFRKEIELAMETRNNFTSFEKTLAARRERLSAVARGIGHPERSDKGAVTVDNLLPSIQHMTMNRWFRTRNRLHELVIYDFLSKYYESAQVRMQQTTGKSPGDSKT